jgi:hypothetical protein
MCKRVRIQWKPEELRSSLGRDEVAFSCPFCGGTWKPGAAEKASLRMLLTYLF